VLGLYGPGFAAGAGALVILAGAHLVNGCLGLTPYVIAMSGRSRLFFLDNLGASLLNLCLGLLLVPRFGIIGAAVASFVSVTGLQLALTIQSWVLERIHPFASAQLKPLAAGVVTAVAEWLVYARFAPGPARVVAVIATGLVVYVAALVALGLPTEERQFVARLWGRLRSRR
jgi:O-antigen/teichoic acid export membrane protein